MKLIPKYEKYKKELIKLLEDKDFKIYGQHLAVPTYRAPVFKIERGSNCILFEFAYRNDLGQVVRTTNKIKYGHIQS